MRQERETAVVRVGAIAMLRPDVVMRRPGLIDAAIIGGLAQLAPADVDILRPTDLLVLRVSFTNMRYVAGEPLRIERFALTRPAYMVVTFPSQHVIERAYFEVAAGYPPKPLPPLATAGPGTAPPPAPDTSGAETPDLPPVFASAAGSSRLVFRVTTESIEYSTPGLLDAMRVLDLVVAPQALPPESAKLLGLTWSDALTSGAIKTSAAFRRGTTRDKASEFITLSRLAATAAHMQYRFGTEAAMRTVGAGRMGDTVGVSDRLAAIDAARRKPPTRVRGKPPLPSEPGPLTTAIELPWRLDISPNRTAAWAHSSTAVDHHGRTELWHTRLGVRDTDDEGNNIVDEVASEQRTVRAIWARDFTELGRQIGPDGHLTAKPDTTEFPSAKGNEDNPEVRLSLNSRDRMMLVHETANFHLKRGRTDWPPLAVPTNRLMLSSLGGWLDSRVEFDTLPDGALTIQEWKHRAAMGRDHFVKVVYAGFLLPFGHKASLVKITERKIKKPGDPAYLYQRMFIIVREHDKSFDHAALKNFEDGITKLKGVADKNGEALPELSNANLVMPFASVQILTTTTPDLDPPDQHGLGASGSGFMFVPYVAGAPFTFRLSAVDREFNRVEFKAPLVFMERDHNTDESSLRGSLPKYRTATDNERRMPLGGQRIAFAGSETTDDTILSTDSLVFDVALRPDWSGIPQDDPRFLPVLRTTRAVVPAMSALAGNADPVELRYPTRFKPTGFTGNQAEVFLETVAKAGLDFSKQADRSGGYVTPSLQVSGLSRISGPIGGPLGDAFDGAIKPDQFFDGISAKLFGVVTLKDLLKSVGYTPNDLPKFVTQTLNVASALITNATALQQAATSSAAGAAGATDVKNAVAALITALQQAPSNPAVDVGAPLKALRAALGQFAPAVKDLAVLNRVERERISAIAQRVAAQLPDDVTAEAVGGLVKTFAGGAKLPEVITARLDWSTKIPPWGLVAGKPILVPEGEGKLSLVVDVQAPTTGSGAEPSVLVSCSISPFTLDLIAPASFLKLHFQTFEFSVAPGKKPDVNVALRKPNGIEFVGPLSFVEKLQSIIPLDGFSDPPYLDITSKGVKAGFDVSIPNLSVGILSLENISLGAHLSVPFIDESLEVGFNFCTRENPFRLTVMLFGGGGFFGLQLTPAGVHVLEAAFEFGAAISINLGVASGGVSIMAGIYFKLTTDPVNNETNAQLTGYFRLRGEVDVLGLISASIELYLELTYETKTQKAVGRATLTIEVEVFFLSFSVEISCEKKFAGSKGDPSFAYQMGLPALAPGAVRPWDVYCKKFAPV